MAAGGSSHQIADRHVLDRPTRLLQDLEREFPDLWTLVERQVERFRVTASWPEWCLMPMNAVQLLVFVQTHPDVREAMARSTDEGQALVARYTATMGVPERQQQLVLSAYITAAALWRLGRGIYRFDPRLQESLLATPLRGEIPTELLYRLPEWAIYVDLDAGLTLAEQRLLGFFAHLEYDLTRDRPELRFLWLTEYPGAAAGATVTWQPSSFPLKAANLGEAREMVRDTSKSLNEEDLTETQVALWEQAISASLNPILYLCSQGADVARRHRPDQRPERARLTPTKFGPRFVNPGGPAWWEVGYRVGRALQAAPEPPPEVVDTGRSGRRGPAPHLRRAHWHLYWTGAGRQTPEIRWLHPMLVGQRGDHELPPTLRRVRTD